MSSKIEVSRELLEDFIEYSVSVAGHCSDWLREKEELRALLAAPVVERQLEPVAMQWQYEAGSEWWAFDAENVGDNIASGTKIRLTDLAGNILFSYPAPELAELQATIRARAQKVLNAIGNGRMLTAIAELHELLDTSPVGPDQLMITLADHKTGQAAYLQQIEAQKATIARLTAEIERLKEVTNFKDAVACVFDNLKMTACNTSDRTWDDQLEDLAEDVIEMAPEYKKEWKDIGKLCVEIERLKGGHGVAGCRERFQKWVLATKHPALGFLDGHWLARGDDREGYANEYVQGLWVAFKEFASQPAPIPVVLPERKATIAFGEPDIRGEAWNACLDKVKELNQ